jgi:Ca-activated chloride channel family protein
MRFLRPDMAGWFLVLPVIVACWLIQGRYIRALRRRTPIAQRFAHLSRRSSWLGRGARLVAALATAGGLVLALLRPQALFAFRTPEFERQDLIIVLDRSASMRAHDIAPSRFTRATLEIRNFLKHKPEAIDRVALVGFADASLVLSYLTSDVSSVFFYLDWVDGDPSVFLGTNIGAALNSAREAARKDPRPTRKLYLLVSDGEDHGDNLKKALATFRSEGLRVHCIGIGSDQEVPIPLPEPDGRETYLKDDNGRAVRTKFSEATLRQIAETTGGRYIRSSTGAELAGALEDIVKGERKLLGWKTSTDYRDLYRVSLAVAAGAGAALWLLL